MLLGLSGGNYLLKGFKFFVYFISQLGDVLDRELMSKWLILIAERYLQPVIELFDKHLTNESILHADETTVKALESDNQTNYLWLFRTGKDHEQPIIRYLFSESRAREVAETYLDHFKGFLHCDGYSGYNIPRLTQVHYLVHIRRKFTVASHTKHTTSEAVNGVNFCNKLFKVEELIKQKQLNGNQLLDYRRTHLKPLLDEFTEWLDHHQYLTKAKLGKAIIYARKMLPSLYLLLDHAGLSISNNSAEQAMRIPALGRKNWLFSQSIKEAIANGYFLTIIQTALANGLDPRKYLEFLIDKLANLPILNHESIEAYLPWACLPQEQCKPLLSDA